MPYRKAGGLGCVEMQIDCVANLTAAIASCNALYFFRSINRLKVVVSSSILHNINLKETFRVRTIHKCLKNGRSYYFRWERGRGP